MTQELTPIWYIHGEESSSVEGFWPNVKPKCYRIPMKKRRRRKLMFWCTFFFNEGSIFVLKRIFLRYFQTYTKVARAIQRTPISSFTHILQLLIFHSICGAPFTASVTASTARATTDSITTLALHSRRYVVLTTLLTLLTVTCQGVRYYPCIVGDTVEA